MWEFGHSDEAYENLRENISKQSKQWLEVVYAEIQANEDGHLNETKYDWELKAASNLSADDLAEAIYNWTMEDRICDNGGFNAYCCPFRCGCHTVSFDKTKDE